MFVSNTVSWCGYCTGKSSFHKKTEAHGSDHVEQPHDDRPRPYLSTTKKDLKIQEKQHTAEKHLLCTYCGKCCLTRGALWCHINIHTGKYKCTECGKCCGRKTYLAEHMQRHSGHKTFECTVCSKRFTTSHGLVVHRKTHRKEKPYKCNVCEKMFNRLDNLKAHMTVHTGEKLYRCSLCIMSFTSYSSLWKHKCRVHGNATDEQKIDENALVNSRYDSGEKMYQCYVCDKVFRHAGHLKAHMRIHTGEKPYKCSVCSKSFMWSGSLWQHKHSVHGNRSNNPHALKQDKQKLFECSMCDKVFTKSCNRNDHMRIHTGEKPYNCSLCNKRFSRSSHLKSHNRHIHSFTADTQKQGETVESDCVSLDCSVKVKEENLSVVKLESNDVRYILLLWFSFIFSQQKNFFRWFAVVEA